MQEENNKQLKKNISIYIFLKSKESIIKYLVDILVLNSDERRLSSGRKMHVDKS